MAAIYALFELIGLIGSAIRWVFARRPAEDGASPPERLGLRYREIAEGREPSGVGCLLVAALPGVVIAGLIIAIALGIVANALAGFPDPPLVVVTLAAFVAWLCVVFGGLTWVVRNARRPGRIDPVLVLTVAIAIDLFLAVFVVAVTRNQPA